MEQKQRVIVYIDGFNFYFGLKSNAKWKKYYWLDIVTIRMLTSRVRWHTRRLPVR